MLLAIAPKPAKVTAMVATVCRSAKMSTFITACPQGYSSSVACSWVAGKHPVDSGLREAERPGNHLPFIGGRENCAP